MEEPERLEPAPAEPDVETAKPQEAALPALDELVSRIPGAARELLDELFRAKFTSVRRVPAAALRRDEVEPGG